MKKIKMNGKWYNLPEGYTLVARVTFQTGERTRIIVSDENNAVELFDDLNDNLYIVDPNYPAIKKYLTEA